MLYRKIITVQLRRLGHPSKNIKVFTGFLLNWLAGSCCSEIFSNRNNSQCPKRALGISSIDGVIRAPVHRAMRSSTGLLTFRTNDISFASRCSWAYEDTLFSTSRTFGRRASIFEIIILRWSFSCSKTIYLELLFCNILHNQFLEKDMAQ